MARQKRPQQAPRRVQRSERPEHQPCILPIHESRSTELRSLHSKFPPPNLHRLLKDATEHLRDSSSKLAAIRLSHVLENEKELDEEQEQEIAKLGVRVEKNLRGLVDMDEQLKMMRNVLSNISDADKDRGNGDGVQPVEEYIKQTQKARKAYRRKDLKERYGNSADYVEFRSLVFSVGKPTAPLPQKKDWFKTPMFVTEAEAEISDEEPVSESEGEDHDPDVEMIDREEESDDDLQETSVTRNLKCPITMRMFENPVKATCGHVFEEQAIKDMFQMYKRLKKPTICPTTGCGKQINLKDLREDELTKRLVEAEQKRAEREAQRALMEEDSDEDDEVIESRSKSKSKQSKQSQQSQPRSRVKEEEIPYGDESDAEGEERVADSHGEEASEEESGPGESSAGGEDEEMEDSEDD